MYSDNLMSIFHLRHGGLAFYGGVIGGAIGALLVCKWRKIKPLPMIDLVASVVLISLAIGRWGNFVNVEAFGSNTTAPWGMTGTAIADYLTRNQLRLAGLGIEVLPCTPVHPTFLYESLWNILCFVLIALYIKRRRFDGEITLLFLGLYGLGRAVIEGLRIDSLMLGGLRVSQGVAALCFVVSMALLVHIHMKIRKSGDPDYLALHVNTVQAQQAAAVQTEEESEPDTDESKARKSDDPSAALHLTTMQAAAGQTEEEEKQPDADDEQPPPPLGQAPQYDDCASMGDVDTGSCSSSCD